MKNPILILSITVFAVLAIFPPVALSLDTSGSTIFSGIVEIGMMLLTPIIGTVFPTLFYCEGFCGPAGFAGSLLLYAVWLIIVLILTLPLFTINYLIVQNRKLSHYE